MSSDSDYSSVNTGLSSTVTGEITVAVVIILFLLFAAALIIFLRVMGYAGPAASLMITSRQNRYHHHHHHHHHHPSSVAKQPLDLSILNAIPVQVYQAKECTDCAVCLSELVDGEKFRRLTKCGHGFHVECIDMWFHSNSTCPLCRSDVGDVSTTSSMCMVTLPIQNVEGEGVCVLDEGSSSKESLNGTNSCADVEQGISS